MDTKGTPVVGAEVTLGDPEVHVTDTTRTQDCGSTDEHGQAIVDVPVTGVFALQARHERLALFGKTLVDASRSQVTLLMNDAGRLRIRLSPASRNIDGTIVVRSAVGDGVRGGHWMRAIPASAESADFLLPAGWYQAEFVNLAQWKTSGLVKVTPGAEAVTLLELPALQEWRVAVLEPDGQVPNSVSVAEANSPTVERLHEGGRFSVPAPRRGTVVTFESASGSQATVVAEAAGFQGDAVEPDGAIRLALSAALDIDVRGAAGGSVEVNTYAQVGGNGWTIKRRFAVQADGHALATGLPARSYYCVDYLIDGLSVPGRAFGVTPPPGQAARVAVDVAATTGLTLTVRGPDGAPVPDAVVSVSPEGAFESSTGWQSMELFGLRRLGRTDAEGNLLVRGGARTAFRAIVMPVSPALRPTETVRQLPLNGHAQVELVVESQASVTGRVLTPRGQGAPRASVRWYRRGEIDAADGSRAVATTEDGSYSLEIPDLLDEVIVVYATSAGLESRAELGPADRHGLVLVLAEPR